IDAGLRASGGDEHGSRRTFLKPHQHELARGARLHIRRWIVLQLSPGARTVRRVFGCADGRDRSRDFGGVQRTASDARNANDAGGTPAFEGFHRAVAAGADRKSTRLNSSHRTISYAVFCLKKKIKIK